jgi:dihydrofolate reductase
MNYVTLQLALTLDGYIARKDGSVDFLEDINSSFKDEFDKFVDSVNTIIMGRGTYEKMLEFEEIQFKDKRIFVLTSKELHSNNKNIVFTNKGIELLLKEIFGKIWLFGGSKVIQSFMNLNLIDEYQLYIVPKIIGEGIPLFLENKGLSNLKLIRHEQFDDDILLVYKKMEE